MVSTPPQELAAHGAITRSAQNERTNLIRTIYLTASRLDRFGFSMLRLGLVVVLCWIGGLKAANYEAEGIIPFVANSPVMSFFYHHPAPEYREQNPAGGLNIDNHLWNETNGTYVFSYGLGCVIVVLGLLIALHPVFPQVAAVGSFLVMLMACTTLSFLVTTPEAWVSGPGPSVHGFPFLALPGLLVVKDSIMLGAAILTMADSAKVYLMRSAQVNSPAG
jgi:reactive chlorine resistance protein C